MMHRYLNHLMVESWITECCSRPAYEPLPRKEVVVYPWKAAAWLHVVLASETGTISYKYRAGLHS